MRSALELVGNTRVAAQAAALWLVVAQLTACSGGDAAEASAVPPAASSPPPATSPPPPSAPPPAPPPPPTANQSPTIAGVAASRAVVSTRYEFHPQAADPERAPLSFSARNRPTWLSLDASTGVLSGTPRSADVGLHRNIEVSVTDGNSVASLPPFTIEVANAAPGPYSGTASAVPGIVEAERFDRGGEGNGYHELTAINTNGAFRPDEGVDIAASSDPLGGNYVVVNFETSEWVAYTIDVATAGNYELALRASSAFTDSAYHVEIDGSDVTGRITVPNTGGWSSFQWVGATSVSLPAGRRVLKIVADRQYFDLNSIRVATPAAPPPPPPPPPPPDPSAVLFGCSFASLPTECGFEEQARVPGRATLTSIARDGLVGVRLHTEPGDNNVVFSGEMERNDMWLSQAASDGYEGREAWWAHSIYFPTDFTTPTWQSYVVFDFHNSGSGPWQANFHVAFIRQADITQPGLLSLIGYGGVNSGDGRFEANLGPVRKNVWYDFVYHVRWSSSSDGFFDAWVNGQRVLSHRGPTLYAGQGVYLKLANYHNPVCDPYPACIGTHQASSVIHDRIIRGTTALSVSPGPLEGVLELVDGVLRPILP